MLTSETKRRIDACRDILVGKLPQPSNQVELITLALIYKFMDDLDEDSVKMGGKRSFFTGELAKYRWRNLLPQTVSADERVALFSRGIEVLGGAEVEIGKDGKSERIVPAAHLPGLFRDIFRNAFLKFRDGRILTMFLTEVNGFAYSHSEELGNAFEYLLQCTGAQGENGQFRTPRHIIDFIVACLDPQPGDKLTHAQRQKVYGNLAGYDVDDQMVKLSKVNLFLHGFPDPAIHIYDTLSNDARWHEKADLILANPPFMTPKGGVTPHTKFRIAAKKAEVLFTDYIAEHLSGDGRGGVIVPNGIVATTQNAYVKLRRFLVEDSLVAVVSLPAGVFKPYSGVKTSILLLDKKLARTAKEILFLKITADGFDLGDKRNPIEANDLPEAERVVKLWITGTLKEGAESTVAWRAVEKKTLLDKPTCTLQGEAYFGGETRTSEHRIVKLGEICEVVRGSSPRPQGDPKFFGGPVPRLMIADITRDGMWVTPQIDSLTEEGAKRSRPMKAGDVVMAVSASPGLPALLKVDACIHDGFAGLKGLPDDVDRTFLYYVLLALRAKHDGQADGATFRNITTDQIREFEIPLPPLEEQRRIVAEIEGYQKVLDGARQILAGYKPSIETNPDWKTVLLGKICTLISGQHIDKDDYNTAGRGMPYLTGPSDFGPISPRITRWTETPKVTAVAGDVLVTVKGSGVGSVNLLDANEIAISRQLMAVRAKGIDSRFLHAFMVGQQDYFQSQASGAAIPGITREHVLSLEIPLPPLPEQQRIVAELDAEAAQMDAVRALIPRFEAKIQRVLDRVWGNGAEANGTGQAIE